MQTANELQTIDQSSQRTAVAPRSATELREQAEIIQDVLKNVMREGVDYDVIPGTQNKSLLKPGTEKIMATFRLAADPEIVDLSTEDEIRYRVNARLISPSGVFVGAGIGECSSHEEKYKWRAMVCEEEFDETDKMRRRKKWKKGWNNKPPTQVWQVRTEPADIANTVLKMAKKRALADAVLTATACSDIFDKDTAKDSGNYGKPPARASRSKPAAPKLDPAPIVAKLEAEATKGEEPLMKMYAELSNDERHAVGADFRRIKKLANPEA